MNNLSLYRQILKGKWFIHYSYALSLAPVLAGILEGKSMGDNRDWDNLQTTNLDEMKDRAPFPILAAAGPNAVSVFEDYNQAPAGSVAVVPLKSVMMKYGSWCQYGTEEIASFMMQAGKSPNIDGVVLDIDSGGGAVDSIPPMLEAINHIRTVHDKPVIACGDLCASAAYYVAAHCDRVIAGNGMCSEFGSIGTMLSFTDMQPYYEKLGIKFHRVYAPESNYKNLAFEKMMKGDYELIQKEELSPLAVKFQNDVKKARGNKLNMEVDGLLNGRMFYAVNDSDPKMSAKSVGLIDEISNIDSAILAAQALGEVRKFLSGK